MEIQTTEAAPQMSAQALVQMVAQALEQTPALTTSAELQAFHEAVDKVVLASMKVITPEPEYPDPDAVAAARTAAVLTPELAASMVYAHVDEWHWWESGEALMPRATWEFFLVLTDQHPTHLMVPRDEALAKKARCTM